MPEKPLIPLTPATSKATETNSAKKPPEPEKGDAAMLPEVKRLEGVTSVDEKVFLECEVLAHAAIGQIADQIASEVANAVPRSENAAHVSVVLLDAGLISALQLFASVQLQLALLQKNFDSVAHAKAGPKLESHKFVGLLTGSALAHLTAAAEGAVNLLGLFREDSQFFGRTVEVKETALFLSIARSLRRAGYDVRYPRLFSFQLAQQEQLSQPRLVKLFDGVVSARQRAVDRMRPAMEKIAGLEQTLIDREREFCNAAEERKKVLTEEIQTAKDALVDARQNLNPDLVLFENTDTSWNSLQKRLTVPDEKTGGSPMDWMGRASEAIALLEAEGAAYLLYAEGVVAGGTMRVKRSLWQTLFFGDALQFSGGAIVAYALFDKDARILTGGTHRYLTPFQGFPTDAPVWNGFNSFCDGSDFSDRARMRDKTSD